MKLFKVLFALIVFSANLSYAQYTRTIELNLPDKDYGFSVLKSLSLRASAAEFDSTDLNLQDLSNLMWAANGINRPREGKRTSPSAVNAQDIDIYVFMKTGVYIYNPKRHVLESVIGNDCRNFVADIQQNFSKAPVFLLLVSDISRFKFGSDSLKIMWGAVDAGIVSQNISLFCASSELATRPRAFMNQQKIRELLKLKDSQYLMLNHPVSYK